MAIDWNDQTDSLRPLLLADPAGGDDHGRPPSRIEAETLRAYRLTHYRVEASPPLTLRVGRLSPALLALHRQAGVSCSAFITAFNPYGRCLPPADNLRRQQALAALLEARGLACIHGRGEDPDQRWDGEDSLLVLGLDRFHSAILGHCFEQNAVVWNDEDGLAHLLLLR